MNVEITTMCGVFSDNRYLMINRKTYWKGWAFLGGHLEKKESITECVVREIYEEAGVHIIEPVYKGFTHIYNPETGQRQIVFNYYTERYSGKVRARCDEGELCWISANELLQMELAEGMEYRLPLFDRNSVPQELYIEWTDKEGYTKVMYKGL